MRGKFITFEGIDGAGKSSHVNWLADTLRQRGLTVQVTREPGGIPLGEKLRELLLNEPMHLETEAMLMFAARREHLAQVIEPALARGDWVVCDRFADSSRAYQGAGGGVAQSFIEQIDAGVVGHDQPDLTLVFDLPVEVGLERAFGRGLFETRFESKGLAFHQRLREGFLRIVEAHPERCVLIDAVGSLDEVEARVWRAVQDRLL